MTTEEKAPAKIGAVLIASGFITREKPAINRVPTET